MSKLITDKINLKMGEKSKDVEIINGFLTKFGYFTEDIEEVAKLTNAAPSEFDLSTTLALKKYQRANNLVETGEYDLATASVMSQPRCGFPDLADYVLDGRKWTHTNLTYSINSKPNYLSMTNVQNAVRAALDLWASVTSLTFNERSPQDPADIRIEFVQGMHGDGQAFDGPGHVLAHAFFPPPNGDDWAGDAHFDLAETWNISLPTPTSEFDLITVAAHEFGHSLGLGHSQVQGALMFPKYNGVHRFLAADDVAGIQAIYGK